MAVATRNENVSILANTNTFNGPGRFKLVLVGGSAASTVSIAVNGSELISLAAVIGDTAVSPCIKLGPHEATVTLAGTGAKAYAVWE